MAASINQVDPARSVAPNQRADHSRPLMRVVFVLGSALVTIIGADLLFFNRDTALFFAWTIEHPATAVFLGSFYWSAGLLAGMSARKDRWSEARVGVLGVLLFVVATLMLSLMHLRELHLQSGLIARLVTYAWLVVYALDPLLIVAACIGQLRSIAEPGRYPVPAPFRAALFALGTQLLICGVIFFLKPESMGRAWPWATSAVDGRAIAAWLIGLGVVILQAGWEGLWERIAVALQAATLLGGLQLVLLMAFIRGFHGVLAPGVYLLDVGAVFALGLLGTAVTAKLPKQEPTSPRSA